MKRIVICFDGTWNKAEKGSPTNVCRLWERLEQSATQIAWYDPGVGTTQWQKLRGAFGFGLSRNIQQGYTYLALTYEPGDQIFLFGFSRGAYSARSLAGLIRKCGILRRAQVPAVNLARLANEQVQEQLDDAIEKTPAIEQAYELYRQRDEGPDTPQSKDFRSTHSYPLYDPSTPATNTQEATRIHFIGVWDTVGSLGVPLKSLQWVSAFNANRYLFHDTKLSGIVTYARHALAIDEYRKDYAPALWTPDDQWPADRLKQRWFIGAHGDVGGGYAPQQPLADVALEWMIAEAQAVGLDVTPSATGRAMVAPSMAPITPTHENFLFGTYKWFSSATPRPVMKLIANEQNLGYRNQDTDPTVAERLRKDNSYHPQHAGLRTLAGLKFV